MRISSSRFESQCAPLMINGKELELVKQAKVLGIIIGNDLKWNCHVNYIIKRASKRMYFLRQLKRAKMPVADIVRFYSYTYMVSSNTVHPYFTTLYHHILATKSKQFRSGPCLSFMVLVYHTPDNWKFPT